MFQDATLKPLLTEESYTLHGKEAQHFFINKLYTAAVELWSCGAVLLVDRPAPLLPPPPPPLGSSDLSSPTPKLLATRRSSRRRADGLPPRLKEDSNIDMREWRVLAQQPVV